MQIVSDPWEKVVPLKTCFIQAKIVAVKEELAQFNEILKLVEAAHEECKQYMDEEEINNSDKWLDEPDEMILNFKRRCIPG